MSQQLDSTIAIVQGDTHASGQVEIMYDVATN